jgi:membrane protease subunit (stomatin/prohibitin family)
MNDLVDEANGKLTDEWLNFYGKMFSANSSEQAKLALKLKEVLIETIKSLDLKMESNDPAKMSDGKTKKFR